MIYKTARFRKKKHNNSRIQKIRTDHDCQKGSTRRRSRTQNPQTITPAKKTPQAPSYLQKKTNVTLFSDKAIKNPKLFLPDAVERSQGLSGSNSTLSALSRPCQALLLPTSTPLPHDLNYGLPPHPSSNLCRKPKQQSVTKSVLPRCITAQNVQNIKTHGKTPCEDPARQNLLKTTPRSTEKRRIDP